MRLSVLAALLVMFLPASAASQSLAEVARKEKERRKDNDESGRQVSVITEAELTQGRAESLPETDGTTPSPRTGTKSRRIPSPTKRGSVSEEASDPEEEQVPENIPLELSLRQRLRMFELMRASYEREVHSIDEEIAKNKARLVEIERELASLGAGSLPVAPRADRGMRSGFDFYALMNEKAKLIEENKQLEGKKETRKDALLRKGRRAGIPAGYLRF
ncbi:MAG: hypothetical protein ACE5JI_10620 [Acidobacteriota bacterium]